MAVDIVMPQMGESIFEGTITKWLKKPGDKVQRDEPLFEISTDKVDAEIPAQNAAAAKGGSASTDGASTERPTGASAQAEGDSTPKQPPAPETAPGPQAPASAATGSNGAPGADVVMPQMGESIFEGTITKWLKKVGDKVQRDEPLFEI